MELRQYTNILVKWWWLIALSVVAASVATYLGSRAMPRTYVSRTTLMVGQALQNPNPSQTEFSTGQVLAQGYADLAKREPVLKATLDALGLNWDWTVLQGMVSTHPIPGTQLLELSVQDTDPQRAKVLVAEVAHQLILQSPAGTDAQKDAERQFILNQIEELKANIQKNQDEIRRLDEVIAQATSTRQIQEARDQQAALQSQASTWQATYAQLLGSLQGAPNFLSVVEPAQTPAGPVGSRTGFNVLLAAAIGFALAVGAALVLEYTDDTIKTPEDVQQVLNLTMLAGIAEIEGEDYPSKLVVVKHPRSPVAEAYRMLRTNLQFSAADHPLRTLMVTASNPLEGKSVTAANLAAAIAQSGTRVILVDADLRRPVQHDIFGLDNQVGLTTVLQEGTSLARVLQAGPLENLSILASGPIPDNPSELLESDQMEQAIEALCQQADMVVFDSPPVMAVADATILAMRVDSTLLVVDAGNTRRALAQQSKEILSAAGACLSGVALNRLSTHDGDYYSYAHYYTEDEKRVQRRSPRDLLVPRLDLSKVFKAHQPVRPAAGSGRITPRVARRKVKPLGQVLQEMAEGVREAVGPVFGEAAHKATRVGATGKRASTASVGPKPTTSVHQRDWSRVALFGISGLVTLAIVVVALSLSYPRPPKADNAATLSAAIAQMTPSQTTNDVGGAADSVPTTVTENLSPRQTETAQVLAATSAAATETAGIAATATQQAVNAAAARQALGFIECDTIDLEILQAPTNTLMVAASATNVQLQWQVSNKATSPNCKWGEAGQETKLLRAMAVGGQPGSGIPVKLKWVREDVYDLSLNVQLSVGRYALSWRLVLPKTGLPAGPDLEAKVSVLRPTPRPTATPLPSPTSCPLVTYDCNCGRNPRGEKVCDVCVKEQCP